VKGVLITLEGIDGSGKDTLAQMIKKYLEDQGIDVIVTREPGDVYSGKVRDILVNDHPSPLSEVFLFMADRHEHVMRVIKPALEEGKWVISVRFTDSSMAYQGARGIDREFIQKLNIVSVDGVYPKLTILLDLPVDVAMSRIGSREGEKVEHFEKEEFLKKVRDLYLEDAYLNKDRIVVVDATMEPNDVFNAVKPYIDKLVQEYYPAKIDITRSDIAEVIIRATRSGMHAFLIHGPWGCGHRHLIRNIVYSLLPDTKEVEEEPYGFYSHDVMIVYGEKPSSIKIDMIREIGDFLDFRPVGGDYKIVIIDDASYMTLQAANALLKILEEPPEWGMFLLYTSYPERILSTIRSRCLSIRLNRFSARELASYIREHYDVSPEMAYRLARLCEGCPDRVSHVMEVLSADSLLPYIKGDFYQYVNNIGSNIVEDEVLWDKLFWELEDILIDQWLNGKEGLSVDDLLTFIEFEGMLKRNVQKKLIADLIYWQFREGIKHVHVPQR